MREIIVFIDEMTDYKVDDEGYNGVLIKTNKQEILLLISSGQSCCEQAGYLTSEDDQKTFEGAEILSIETVDEGFTPKMVEAGIELDAGGIVFVNINTSKGTLQFAAYNSQNGYYGHTVKIISHQLNHEDYV